MKTRSRKKPAPQAPADRIVQGFNISRSWKLLHTGGLLDTLTETRKRSPYFYRREAIRWLHWALGRGGFGGPESRHMGKSIALGYLDTYRRLKTGGAR
jgi:hypothetical protein